MLRCFVASIHFTQMLEGLLFRLKDRGPSGQASWRRSRCRLLPRFKTLVSFGGTPHQ